MNKAILNKNIGNNIRSERYNRNLTIEEFSEVIGIAPGFLGLIERGQRGTSLENLVKISKFLNMSLDDLIINGISVNHQDDISKHREIINSYIKVLSEKELEFLIDVIKSFIKKEIF